MATRKVEVAIVGDASSLVRAFGKSERAVSGFGKRGSKLGAVGMGMLAGAAAGVTVAVGQGLVKAFQTGINEFSEAERMSAQTAAALKSTGNAAGVTQKHIEDMAGALQKQTGLQDDAIQGAQNLLLTFTKISNAGPDKIFDRATRATMDLSVAFGKDMNSTAIMVGKALNDPIKGVTALTRVGVSFTSSQKETIKSLAETGRVAAAQKLILKELETQVGGSAKAFGETTPGQIAKAQRAFEDLTQGVVTAVAPLAAAVLPGLTSAINGVTTFFQNNWPKIQQVAQQVWAWLSANLGPTFQSIGQSVTSIVTSIVAFFRTYWPQILAVVRPVMAYFSQSVKTGFQIIAGVLKLVASILRGDFAGAWQAIKSIGQAALTGLVSLIKNIPQALWAAAVGLLKAARDLGKRVVEKIAEGIASAPGLIKQGISRLFGIAGEAGAINPYLSQITGQGAKVPEAVAKGIKAGQGRVSSAFSVMTGGATNTAKGGAGTQASPVGQALSNGIAQGVRDAGPNVGGAISSVIRQGIQQAKSENDIRSPSGRTARELGRPLADGTAKGIRQRGGQVRTALTGIVNAGMRAAVASAKNNAISLAGSLASMFGQARTAGDTGRLGDLERQLAADQSARQEDSLKRAKDEAIAEEAAKLAAKAGAEDAAQAERDYQDAVRTRLDAEAQLSDFYRQREIENLRTDIEGRKTQYENDINNLAAQFGRGEISAQQFSDSLDALIGGERGGALGGAFALQFEMALKAVKDQLAALGGISGVEGVMPGSATPERPRETWERDVANVRANLESQWERKGESWKKANKKDPWVRGKLNNWIKANKAKYGLATGGITQGPMPAIIGEAGREAVIPLEGPRARRMLRAGGIGGTVVNLTFNGVLDAREAARVIQPELNRLVSVTY